MTASAGRDALPIELPSARILLHVNAAVEKVIEEHRAAGRTFDAGGVQSFVREQGDGEAVVMLHGVPSSCFLYRKMLAPLSESGLRAIAFDFPGLGLAARPEDFDYSWSGLARWTGEALDELDIEHCHIVVHDIGGMYGLAFASEHPGRLLTLTVFNTLFHPDFRWHFWARMWRTPLVG